MSTHRVTEPTASTGGTTPLDPSASETLSVSVTGHQTQVTNPPETPSERTSCPTITYEARPCSDLASRLAQVYQWSLEAVSSVRPRVAGIGGATTSSGIGFGNEHQTVQEKER